MSQPPQDPQQPYGQQPQPGSGQPQYEQRSPQGYPQQPPQVHGQQPYGQPQQPPPPMNHRDAKAQARGAKAQAKAMRPWWKKKRFILPLALVALIALVSIGTAGGGNDPAPVAGAPASSTAPQEDETTTTEAPAPAKPASAKIGDKVSAGDWDFKVTKLKCGEKSVGSQYANKKAQGQFCMMNLQVTNNGTEAGNLLGSNQKILDKDGRTFSSDDEAAIYADESNSIFEEINPGNTLKGVIIFDIPKSAKPVQAQLAGGLFGIKDVATVDLT